MRGHMTGWIGRGAAAPVLVIGTVALLGATPGANTGDVPAAEAFAGATFQNGVRGGGVLPLSLMADPCVAGLLGDVTNDAAANVIDAQQIARAAAGLPVSGTVSGRLTSHGDVTGDGTPNVIDAQQIARVAAGLSSPFPVSQPMCTITVNTSSTGAGIDPDGFQVRLDGALEATVAATGTVDLTSLDVGSYTVSLGGIATNCSITNGGGDPDRAVSVVAGGTASVSYELSCISGVGAIWVQNDTEGPFPAADYTVTLDGTDTRDMAPGDGSETVVKFENVSVGSHTVTIGNVPGNCTVALSSSKDFDVTEGGLHQHQFVVNCT